FLLLTCPLLFAQKTESLASFDSSKVMLQMLLRPSFNTLSPDIKYVNAPYKLDYTNSKIQHYLNVFNGIMATFLLVKASDEIDLRDYSLMNIKFNGLHNAFQYNAALKRNRFNYKTDLLKAYW